MRKLGIAICLMVGAAVGASAWGAEESSAPPDNDDEQFDCPHGTFQVEGGHECVKLHDDAECPEGWVDTGDACSCETGVTNDDGTCNREDWDDGDDITEPGEPEWPFGLDPWDVNHIDVSEAQYCGPGWHGVYWHGVFYCREDCDDGWTTADDWWGYDNFASWCYATPCDNPYAPPAPCSNYHHKSYELCGGTCASTPYLPGLACALLAGTDDEGNCQNVDGIVLDNRVKVQWIRGLKSGRPTVIAEYAYPAGNNCPVAQTRNASGICAPLWEVAPAIPNSIEAIWLTTLKWHIYEH